MNCKSCEANPTLGAPSQARWLGPDDNAYCSMHFRQRFGFAEPLVKIEGYEPPKTVKPPAKKKPKAKKKVDA